MPRKTTNRGKTKDVQPYSFSDERTKRKIRRHLNDINDVITDKDIKNAKVPGAEPLPAKTRTPKKKPGLEDNVIDDTPGNPATPWDLLQE